jgi:hypothetical protein
MVMTISKTKITFTQQSLLGKATESLLCFDISEIRDSASGEDRHGIEVITLAALGVKVLLKVKLCSALFVNSFHDGKGVARVLRSR